MTSGQQTEQGMGSLGKVKEMKRLVLLFLFVLLSISCVLTKTPPSSKDAGTLDGDNPVAYYPFNMNANDESGYGNHGTVYGATLTTDRFGQDDSAYYFDGTSDRIVIDDNPQLHFGNGDFSISGWFQTTYVHDDGSGVCLLDKYSQKGKPWTSRLHSDGRLRFLCDESIYSKARVNDGQWHHFVALRSDGTNQLYLDGELQGTASSTSSATNAIPLCFGCVIWSNGKAARFFKGSLDEIRIYDRALSELEIRSLYRTTAQP